jgi:SOS response regulatory protein OraA/RecX
VGGREAESAQEAALRALRHRDLSVRGLEERLRARGYPEPERDKAIDALLRTGLLDDARFAESRARTLAARGGGDALIRHDLSRAGVDAESVQRALSTLAPESERARAIVDRRGTGPKTARYLAGKGFSDDAVSAVIASAADGELG